MRLYGICLAINFSQHDVDAAQDGYSIAHFMAAYHFRENLQVDEGWPAQLGAPGIFAAIADKVDAQFALATLQGKVGFAARRAQRDGGARPDGAAGHLIDGNTAQANAFRDFLHTHQIASEAVTFLAYLGVDGDFT